MGDVRHQAERTRSASSGPGRPDSCWPACWRCTASRASSRSADARRFEARIRAGVLEQGTVALLGEAGVAERLHAKAWCMTASRCRRRPPCRIDPRADGQDVASTARPRCARTCRRAARRDGRDRLGGGRRRRRASSGRPRLRYRHGRRRRELVCDFVAGCDGFHGVAARRCRLAVETSSGVSLRLAGRPADVPPCSTSWLRQPRRGFALARCARRPAAATTSSAALDEKIEEWPARDMAELKVRLRSTAAGRATGPSLEEEHARGGLCRRRCGTAGCSWPATRPTSCRRPAPRASTSRRRTCTT